jgi:hypothetical protein
MQGHIDSMNHQAACYLSNANAACYDRELLQNTPSMMLRPRLSIDGNQWCALCGENLQDGVAGFGDSPEAAYRDFDKAWSRPLGQP